MALSPSAVCFRGTAILPGRLAPDTSVVCDSGRIAYIGARIPRGVPVVEGAFLSPGFIDIHVHGGDGADYMDGTPDAVRIANRAHAQRGTTTIFPTTTTGSTTELSAMLTACREVRDTWTPADGARIEGVHYYGPYFAEDKVGCHAVEGRRDPLPDEYETFFKLGIIRIATCAAELPGAEAFYKAARRHRCLSTCGHSNCSWSDMAKAYRAGMRHVDHFWCAMSSVASLRERHGTPMQASMEQFVLAHPEMSTEVIADGMHLSPELLEFAYQMKGAERLCLVTDANRALGQPPGRYRFGPVDTGAWFESDGRVGFVPGNGLASSVVGMDTMVRNMKARTTASLPEVVRMASLTPAERAGIDKETGSLEKGKAADVLVLSRTLRVQKVFIAGNDIAAASPPSSARRSRSTER